MFPFFLLMMLLSYFGIWHQCTIQWHESMQLTFSLHPVVELARKTTRFKASTAASLPGYQNVICFLFNCDNGPPETVETARYDVQCRMIKFRQLSTNKLALVVNQPWSKQLGNVPEMTSSICCMPTLARSVTLFTPVHIGMKDSEVSLKQLRQPIILLRIAF
jgi:hypothetical protein